METKKQKIISIVATIGVILTLIGATYAYFQAQVGEGKSTDVNINANTVDVFMFATGDGVALTLDQENFAQGTGNQSASTYASATLSANNKTNTATEHYYLYLNITNNNFDYTSEDNKPEILVKITDTNGTELVDSDIEGLNHKTVVDANGQTVTGFDITNKTGLITILDNREITTTSTKEEKYTFTFIYVNYDFDQSANAGKSFSTKVLIQKEKQSVTLASWVKEEYAAQTEDNKTIYLHGPSLENGAGDNSYRYSGASSSVNNYVCFGSDEETCPYDNLYRIIGVFDDRVRLIKVDYATSAMLGTDTTDYYGTYSSGGFSASYYQGSMDTSTIPAYYWNKANYNASYLATKYYNDWSYSELNITHLNKNYISYLDNINTKWASMIDTTTWSVSGNTTEDLNAQTAYTNEITSPSTQVTSTYESKIGLMYISDYGFAASPSAWTITLYNYNGDDVIGNKITEENWMYMGLYEWTLTRSSSKSNFAYYVSGKGLLLDRNVDDGLFAVRPVFHLLSSISYVSGAGSESDPIRVN